MTTTPHLQKEMALYRQGFCFIAGLDEAGRGAWAGPVVAAAVILPLDQPDLAHQLAGLNDSKQLSPLRRDNLFEAIEWVALALAVGVVPATVVDERNIVAATRQAMAQALQALAIAPDYLLVDHLRLPTIPIPQASFAKADAISLTVAAASVIAKVSRDRLLIELDHTYPGYGFARHKGYGTAVHRAALAQLGPCPIHRRSYKPVQNCNLSIT
jgi:ribonuclease HII